MLEFSQTDTLKEMNIMRLKTLRILLLLICGIVILAGCGNGEECSEPTELSEQEALIDNALREALKGNHQPVLDLIPPGFDDHKEEYAEGLRQSLALEGAEIEEMFYRTETVDDTRVKVYFWGTIRYEDNDGFRSETSTEQEASMFPLVSEEGRWYMDIASIVSGYAMPE